MGTYQRQLGSRPYRNYSAATLEECLTKIKNGEILQREAHDIYHIPRSTIQNKLKEQKKQKKHGHPTVFSEQEEESFVKHLLVVSEYGFPLSKTDLRYLVKAHLDGENRKVPIFQNNLPGDDWVSSFLKRHPELSLRRSANIKRARAAVSPVVIDKYFDHAEVNLKDLPPENIFDFDETNVTDDPGSKKVISKRGAKYPERVMNASKASISIMFCGNAAGDLMSPYVVYKATHLWSSWTRGGLKGTYYNRTLSGWFDLITVEDWFVKVALPYLKKIPGRKALIGDNLSAHFSPRVLDLCAKNNISFMALPPNSTHSTQPLDVSFFRPLKILWRKILENYRMKHGDQLVTKQHFPQLSKQLMDAIGTVKNKSLINGFAKCGLYPLNRNAVLERLPSYVSSDSTVDETSSQVSHTLIRYLSEQRYGGTEDSSNGVRPRRTKLNVPAGKAICEGDIEGLEETRKKKRQSKTKRAEADSDKENLENGIRRTRALSENQKNDHENSSAPQIRRPGKKQKTDNHGNSTVTQFDESDSEEEGQTSDDDSQDDIESGSPYDIGDYCML